MRICLCIAEDDLRTWVMEELLLMTWVVDQPAFVTISDLAAIDLATVSLLLIDAARLPRAPLGVPVIAIGADPAVAGVHVLPAKLTSRELKQAIRAALTPPPRTAESATV